MPSHNHTWYSDITDGNASQAVKSSQNNGNYGRGYSNYVSYTTANTGSGQAHSIVQPTQVVNYIIFAGLPNAYLPVVINGQESIVDLTSTGPGVLMQATQGGAVEVVEVAPSSIYGGVLGSTLDAQSLTPNVWNPVQWNYLDQKSTGVIHSVSSNNSRITPGRLGWYVIHTKIHVRRWYNINNHRAVGVMVFVNGAETNFARHYTGADFYNDEGEKKISTSSLVLITDPSDYFEIRVNPQDSHTWDIFAWYTNIQFYWVGASF